MTPREISLKPAKEDDFEIFVVKNARLWKYIDHDRGSLPLAQDALEYAQSVVTDVIDAEPFKQGLMAPALFAVDGAWSKEDIKTKFAAELKKAIDNQKAWFTFLIKAADDVWERTRQHRAIPDTHRVAAQWMKVERPWVVKSADSFTSCPACFVLLDARAIICSSCKLIIKPEEAAKLKFAS